MFAAARARGLPLLSGEGDRQESILLSTGAAPRAATGRLGVAVEAHTGDAFTREVLSTMFWQLLTACCARLTKRIGIAVLEEMGSLLNLAILNRAVAVVALLS